MLMQLCGAWFRFVAGAYALRTFVFLEAVHQGAHAVVPQLNSPIVQRREAPLKGRVEGDAFHPAAFRLTLHEHARHCRKWEAGGRREGTVQRKRHIRGPSQMMQLRQTIARYHAQHTRKQGREKGIGGAK